MELILKKDKIKLFCFPHAGSSAMNYMKMNPYLDERIDLIPMELPGRGQKFNEILNDSIEELIDSILLELMLAVEDSKYVFFGHSMGSIIAYELAFRILDLGGNGPEHIFFSGGYPPYRYKKESAIHKLPNEEFIKEISKCGGITKEVLDNRKMLEMFTPIIKSDLKAIETYEHKKKSKKLKCNISILNGKDDEGVTLNDYIEWRDCSEGEASSYVFEGGHFYLYENIPTVVDIINRTVLGVTTI